MQTGSPNSGNRGRTRPRARISGGTPFRPGSAARPRLLEPGSKRSTVWGQGVRKTLNVVGGKLLAPPKGVALYYIANREKGV